VARISIFPGIDAFLYQDPEIIRQIWKQSSFLDFRPMATYFFISLCGMSKEFAYKYLNDSSGDQLKPLPGSNVPEELRIHRIIHQSDRQALTGQALEATIRRYMDAFVTKVSDLVPEHTLNEPNGGWLEFANFWAFIQDTVGAGEIEAIFGPNLQRMHPSFVHSLFEFDRMAPSLLKGMSFGRAERLRQILLYQLRTWFKHARKHFTEASRYADGDGDPFWGSTLTRGRHEDLKPLFNDDAMSSHDLGMAWG
jgi:hypothetical protein